MINENPKQYQEIIPTYVAEGLSIFCCYVVYTESTRTSLLGKHKACDEKSGVSTEQEFSSDSDPLHLFIKEDKDVENTSSPYPITSKGGEIIPLSSLPLPPNIPDILEEQSTKPGSHPLNQATSTNSGSQGNSTTESVLFNNGVNGNESLNAGSPRLNQSSQQSHMQCSPKSSLTPMKFVKFQDEILENRGMTSNVGTLSTSGPRGGGAYPIGVSHSSCRTESGGEAVTYNNIILTVDPYSEGMGGGGDIVTTTRVCVELGIQGDSCKDPTNMTPVFVCSVDVEPPDVNLIRDHPVYENKYQFIPGGTKYAESSLQGGTKYTDSARQNELFIQDNSKQVFDRGTQPDDPVGKSSDDPVLNRITSDLDYILNQSSNEFGSLKRGFGGQKGILKKKSSYGKSFEDLRMDTRTSL
ncbi:hypothetical protein M8J76_001446 [Diaphorina citri]|nr:hypothetical protein M8J76_001446 [Diaphorina citri]